MRRRRRTTKRRFKLRGKRVPYTFKNRIYFGRKAQSGSGALSTVIAKILQNVGNVIGI